MRLNLFSLKVLYYFPRDLVKKSCLYVFLSCLNLIIYQLIHTFGPVRSLFVEPPPTGAQTSSSPEPALIETNPTGWSATPTCHILAGCCWKKKIQDINQHLMKDFRKRNPSNLSSIVVSRWNTTIWHRLRLRLRRTPPGWYVRPIITQSYWIEIIYFLLLTTWQENRNKKCSKTDLLHEWQI